MYPFAQLFQGLMYPLVNFRFGYFCRIRIKQFSSIATLWPIASKLFFKLVISSVRSSLIRKRVKFILGYA